MSATSTTLAVGRTPTGAVRLDLLRLVDSRMLIQANSGGGKSWLLRLLVERAANRVQTIILDPEGEFATLREKLDIALVGREGEVATDVRSAALLARKLVELHVSAVVDLYDLRLPDRREYVRLFLESLMGVPRALWHPLLVIVDEAHLFAPERAAGESVSTGAVIALMSQGRKRGFAGILSTQRLSKLHKDAAAEANNVAIGRTWLDTDQQRAGDLLGMSKADRQALRDLAPGEFFAFGPAFLTNGVVRFHSEVVATTHPKAGERHRLAVPQASAAIRSVVEQIGDLPQQAEAEARDLAAARQRIAALERELRARPVQPVPERVVERVEIPIFKDGEVGRLQSAAQGLEAVARRLVPVMDELKGVVGEITATSGDISAAVRAAAGVANRPAVLPNRLATAPAPVRTVAPVLPAGEGTKLPKAERSILTVLAQHPQGRTKTQVAILTGYSVKGGGFNNAIGALRSAGHVTGDREQLAITDAGLQALGTWEPLPTGRALIDHWRRELPRAERAILTVLVEHYPQALTKEHVAQLAGYEPTGGGFNNALGKLRTLELISGRCELRASGALMGGE